MSRFQLFTKLIISDIKRLKKYILKVLISVTILLTLCGIAGLVISKNIYEEKTYEQIAIAYYIPDDADKKFNNLGAGMLQNTESVKDTAVLTEVATVEEGMKLIESGEVMYFIVIPDNFFSGIMDGTNPKVQVIVKENSTIAAYISNELFFSYASYLGIAQSAIYSALDTMYAHDYPDDVFYKTNDKINIIFLERALGKDSYIEEIDTTNEGDYTLLEHYMASATIICLFFMSFIMMTQLFGYKKGLLDLLNKNGINKAHIFVSKFIYMSIALYAAYIPCHIIMGLLFKKFNFLGFIKIIPVVIIIALIIALISSICNNVFSANMIILLTTIIIMYIGGGILPSALLPSAVQGISSFLPGKYLIKLTTLALFGF